VVAIGFSVCIELLRDSEGLVSGWKQTHSLGMSAFGDEGFFRVKASHMWEVDTVGLSSETRKGVS